MFGANRRPEPSEAQGLSCGKARHQQPFGRKGRGSYPDRGLLNAATICYLDLILAPAEAMLPVGEAQRAVPVSIACEDWFVQKQAIARWTCRTASATITLARAAQYDNAANEMSSDFPEITAITSTGRSSLEITIHGDREPLATTRL